jgi:hypothetical protein
VVVSERRNERSCPRFQSWLDVEAALAEPTIIPAEMPDLSIHGMRIGDVFADPEFPLRGNNTRLSKGLWA